MELSLFDESMNSESTVCGLAPRPVLKRASVVPRDISDESNPTIPITVETRRMLGMGGKFGAEVSFELDTSDPDSDMPDALSVILSNQAEGEIDMLSFVGQAEPSLSPVSPPPLPLPSPSTPPVLELPSFHVQRMRKRNQTELVEGEDTKKSFDFKEEIQKLNKSGASDRANFVEQVESMFKTLAKIDFRGFARTRRRSWHSWVQRVVCRARIRLGLRVCRVGIMIVGMKEPCL